jgi:outer membrane protein OmpA-like peptidoglycan-associated protein
LVAAAIASQAASAEIGRIKAAIGSATVMRGKSAVPAKPGLVLDVADVLVTGKDGRIGVTFIDNSRFAVGPNSRVALTKFEFDDTTHKGSSLTTVDRGSLAIVSGQIAKENRDEMKVRTPTSLLAARGTRFVVEAKKRSALASAVCAFGCAPPTRVSLLDGEGGAPVGAVAVFDGKTSAEQGVLDTANTRAGAGRKLRVKKISNSLFGWLTGSVPDREAHFTLYFQEGTTDLTPESEPVLQQMLSEVGRRSGVEVQVTGHTDTVGSEMDNDALSLARAQEVRDVLVQRGLDLSTTRAVGRGERELLVATDDSVAEPRNRRVEIIVR